MGVEGSRLHQASAWGGPRYGDVAGALHVDALVQAAL